MIRFLAATVMSFTCAVVLALGQGQDAQKKDDAPKNPPEAQDGKKNDAEKPKPREDPKEVIKQLQMDFDSAREKLQNKDTGKDTRKTQKAIVDGIDKLLNQDDDNNKGGGGGGGGQQGGGGGGGSSGQSGGQQGGGGNSNSNGPSGGSSQQKQNNPMVGDNQNKDQQADSKDKDDQKKKDDQLSKKDQDNGGGKGDAKKDDKGGGKGASGLAGKGDDSKKDNSIASLKKDIWGHLPDHRRKEMDAFSNEKFMPQYEELLRQYYRTLGETNRRKNGD